MGPRDIPERVTARVLERCELDPSTGCLLSKYSTGSHGYAQVGWHEEDGRRVMTLCHRVAWIAATGRTIPAGYTIDHTCKNRICVNGSHLRLLPNFENARRTNGRDWPVGQCVNGHPNSMLVTTGKKWKCGPCNAESQARYRERKRLARSVNP